LDGIALLEQHFADYNRRFVLGINSTRRLLLWLVQWTNDYNPLLL
jgi:hypothetical protein